jgi:hypothetical protein
MKMFNANPKPLCGHKASRQRSPKREAARQFASDAHLQQQLHTSDAKRGLAIDALRCRLTTPTWDSGLAAAKNNSDALGGLGWAKKAAGYFAFLFTQRQNCGLTEWRATAASLKAQTAS